MKNPIYLLLALIFQIHICFAQSADQIKIHLKEFAEQDKRGQLNADRTIGILKQYYQQSKSIKYAEGISDTGIMLMRLSIRKGEYRQAIETADDILKSSDSSLSAENSSELYRMQALAYGNLGIIEKSRKGYFIALKFTKQIPDKDIRHYRSSLLYENMTSYFDQKKIFPDSIFYYLQKSLSEAKKIDEATGKVPKSYKYDMIILLYSNLGQYYMEIANPPDMKLAEEQFQKALGASEAATGSILKVDEVALFSAMSRFYLKNKDSKKATEYALKTLETEKAVSAPYYRLDAYQVLSQAYLDTDNKQLSRKYLELFTKLDDSIKILEKHAIDSSVNKIISDEKNANTKKRNDIVGIIAVFFLIACSIVIFLWRRQTKKMHQKYEMFMQGLKVNKNDIKDTEESLSKETSGFEISNETISALLIKLEKFENSDRYLKKSIDLSSLSFQLNTNPKYLSEVIKQHRGKSFNSYINGLRIDYITKKLYEDPQFSLYKISYLAEVCGFSSRDVFTSIFKKETGVTPSYFIENINKRVPDN